MKNLEVKRTGLSWSSLRQVTAAGCKFQDLHLLQLSLKFTFLKTSVPLILLHEFFIHKIIHSFKYKRLHKLFFKKSVSGGRRMRATFLFPFFILCEVPNSWLMVVYLCKKKKGFPRSYCSAEMRSQSAEHSLDTQGC